LWPIGILPSQAGPNERLVDVDAVYEHSAQLAPIAVQAMKLDRHNLSEYKVGGKPLRTGGIGLLPFRTVDTD
jgi:hypothetical protein